MLALRCCSRRPREARTLQLVALGDSLTAGYGLPPGQAFPEVLQRALRAKGYDVEVANAGVSGETAEDGLARFDWSVPAGHGRADRRTRRQRHAARHAARRRQGGARRNSRARRRQAHIATLLTGMRAAPEPRRRLPEEVRRDLSRSRRALRRRALSVLPRRRRRRPQAEPEGRAAPDARGGGEDRRGDAAGGREAPWRGPLKMRGIDSKRGSGPVALAPARAIALANSLGAARLAGCGETCMSSTAILRRAMC